MEFMDMQEDDFVYVGKSKDEGRYFKSFLVPAHPPELSNQWLHELREIQERGEWNWGDTWPDNIPYLSINSDQTFPVSYKEPQIRWESPDEVRQLEDWIVKCGDIDDYSEEGIKNILCRCSEHEQNLFLAAMRLKSCKRFVQRRSGIRELCFLKQTGQLKELDLRCNDVEDISEVSGLDKLKELNLDYNLVSDISPLSGLPQLATLYLRYNRIKDLSALRALPSLKVLCLDGNPLALDALSCLRKCKRLSMLSLSYTGIKDISDLEYCRAHSLSLEGNPDISGLEVIATMKNLSSLHLDKSVADRYDIPAIAPRFTEYGSLNGVSLYVWPEKFW